MKLEKRYTYEQYSDASNIILESIRGVTLELPNSKNKLFNYDQNYNFHIYKSCKENLYLTGYLKSAKILSRVTLYSNNDIDSMIYPIIFMYRHYLELKLKALIKIGFQVTNNKISDKQEEVLLGHKLMPLWNLFKPHFNKISGHNPNFENVKKGAESTINQFHEVDKLSMSFRYSKDKEGKENLDLSKEINLLQFCESIEKLTDLLEGVGSEFDSNLEYV